MPWLKTWKGITHEETRNQVDCGSGLRCCKLDAIILSKGNATNGDEQLRRYM